MRAVLTLAFLLLAGAVQAQAPQPTPDQYRQDALGVEALINAQYAYLDRFPGGVMPMSDALRAEAAAVHDHDSLLRYAERALTALADPHAITGNSFRDDWAITPSYSDLWVEASDAGWSITAVREGSPAEKAGIQPYDALIAVDGVAVTEAVRLFWNDLGLDPSNGRAAYAARVLAAGRRDRPRNLTLLSRGETRRITLDNLYTVHADRPPVTVSQDGAALVVRFNDSLGEDGTIAAFDAALASAMPGQPVVLDLTDTASGGNTSVARAVMGWFVDGPRAYQIHNLPAEERETGVPRQWIEQVLPRPGKHYDGPVTVRVGRWTGSMGEGLAIGLDALGAHVVGDPMAGLLGAVYDERLPNSGLVLKIPSERLYAVDGTPRERFVPARR